MINVDRVWSRPRHFNELTGLTLQQGEKLLEVFSDVRQEFDRLKRTDEMGCMTKKGGKTKFDSNGLLFLILYYLRHYPKYSTLELIFEMDKKNLCKWIDDLKRLLRESLDRWSLLPLDDIRYSDEFRVMFQLGDKVYIDGAERPILRPEKAEEQRACYSGKKKDTWPRWLLSQMKIVR